MGSRLWKTSSEKRSVPDHARVAARHAAPITTREIWWTGQTVLRTKAVCPCGGGCPRCAPAIQPKLAVGAPNDKYEQEADRVADKVMRMPEPGLQRQSASPEFEEEPEDLVQPKPLADQITPLVQRQAEPEEEEELQMKASPGRAVAVGSDLESRIEAMEGGGQPLRDSTRAFFEPRFGCDLSHIRVHADHQAIAIARMLNARAFTAGRHVAFGAGQYSPETAKGQRLLAHELTHVQQQGSPGAGRLYEKTKARGHSPKWENVPQSLRRGHSSPGRELLHKGERDAVTYAFNSLEELRIESQSPLVEPHPYAPCIMAKLPLTYREKLQSGKIRGLPTALVNKLETVIKNPARTKRQAAIDEVLKVSGLKALLPAIVGNTMLYEPDLVEKCKRRATGAEKAKCNTLNGRTIKYRLVPSGRNVRVEIGPNAFDSVAELYSTLYHEYVHVQQRTSISGGPRKDASEVEAYSLELKHAGITGIAGDIVAVVGAFNNLRQYYLKLKSTERQTYAKDYSSGRYRMYQLILKHVQGTQDPFALGLALQCAKDFLKDVGQELESKDRTTLAAAVQKENKRLFLSEADRISKLSQAPDYVSDWHNLKASYAELPDSDKKKLLLKYDGVLARLFGLLVKSIANLKAKTSRLKEPLFTRMELRDKQRVLRSLYGDMSSQLQRKLRRRYERASK